MIMLLIIAGISFIWYFLYQDRQKTSKKNNGKDEFDVLLETTEVNEEDKDTLLNKDKTYVDEEEYTCQIPDTPDETINIEIPVVVEKPKKKRKYNKKKSK